MRMTAREKKYGIRFPERIQRKTPDETKMPDKRQERRTEWQKKQRQMQ